MNAKRGKLLVIVAAVVLVLGAAVLVFGLTSSSSASSDRDKAKVELAAAQKQHDEAKAELKAAIAKAQPIVTQAQKVASIGDELCDCDGALANILAQQKAAVAARDGATFNALIAQFNTQNDAANAALTRLRAARG